MPNTRIGLQNQTYITITDDVKVADVHPFGINIGFHNRFGASQLLKNVIVNPGFESGEFATIAIVDAGGSPQRFAADNWQTRWNDEELKIGQPVGFWEGADYEVVFGASQGRRGKIVRFRHEGDRYAFYTDNRGASFATGDVVYLRHKATSSTGGLSHAAYDAGLARPNSYGKQSLRLEQPPQPWLWSYVYTMDSVWRDTDSSAGKLLIADGEWKLDFWLRGLNQRSVVEIEFCREGETSFHKELITPGDSWKHIVRTIKIPDGADRYHDPLGSQPARVITLKFRVKDGWRAWIDDLSLERTGQTNPTVFSDKFVAKLKELRPGVLRNWGWQLGSTFENQLALPTARRMTGYSPKSREATQFHFSLHEFLELAQEIGAAPWYVIPPTFTHLEIQNLVAYLAAPDGQHPYASRRAGLGRRAPWTEEFETIHLEYGNEMWGANQGSDPFLGATVRGGERLGTIASQRFESLRNSPFYGRASQNLNLIVGGQTNAFERQQELARYSQTHDSVALSPYFGHLDNLERRNMFTSLYARAFQDVWNDKIGLVRANVAAQVRGVSAQQSISLKKTSIYEINFHTTTDANIPLETRNKFVSSIAGGIALPLYMLLYLRDGGIREQCAFTALQYSYQMHGTGLDGQDVRLWGLLRDLEATGRARPTWLALQLVNRAMQGDLVDITQRGSNPFWKQLAVNRIVKPLTLNYVQSFAFKQGDFRNVILFNLHQAEAQQAQLEFPNMPQSHGWLHQLSAESPLSNNEQREEVKITTTRLRDIEPQYAMTLPPHSISLVETQGFSIFLPTVMRAYPARLRPK